MVFTALEKPGNHLVDKSEYGAQPEWRKSLFMAAIFSTPFAWIPSEKLSETPCGHSIVWSPLSIRAIKNVTVPQESLNNYNRSIDYKQMLLLWQWDLLARTDDYTHFQIDISSFEYNENSTY